MSDQIILKHYPIIIGADLSNLATWFPEGNFSRIVIITDHIVEKRYGKYLENLLNSSGYPCLLLSFPAGERSKNYRTKHALELSMQRHHCDRNTLILALGGGVVGDLAGYIAATYLRGVSYIHIPTTLLSLVDSSIGGKTGINTMYGKNLIGALYPPLRVVTDLTLIKSLPQKHRINGLIEAIKIFLTHDRDSLNYTEAHLDRIIKGDELCLKEIVIRSTCIKAAVVQRDEKEYGERRILNFGHTIGHALEHLSHYRLLHGYAVGYGILVESTISHLLGLLSSDELHSIYQLLSRLHIHGKKMQKYAIDTVIQTTRIDKKSRHGNVHYILLQKIGQAQIIDKTYSFTVADDIVKKAFQRVIES